MRDGREEKIDKEEEPKRQRKRGRVEYRWGRGDREEDIR